MKHEDDFIGEWRTERIDNSRPPLRWIANLFGEISGWAILRVSYAEEYDNKISAFIYGKIFDLTWPTYNRWGTVYKINFEDEDF